MGILDVGDSGITSIGNGSGKASSSLRLFAKIGYRVAMISRGPDHLNKLVSKINNAGGEAEAFPISDYTTSTIRSAFTSMKSRFPSSTSPLRVAVFNAAYGTWKPFLDVTDDEVRESLDTNILAAFAFSKEVLLEFTKLEMEDPSEGGQGGERTLIFTGATAALRGNATTSVLAMGKFGVRTLAQSLAKEFGKQNIHVAQSIMDGGIITDRTRAHQNDPSWENNADRCLDPDSIAKSYLYPVQQDSSAWTWELDLRPAYEQW
ncbi:hypothetical protein HYDPIDRAFT_183364 [Hydnomerulius pinastri MD-312]|uniref:3-oxoacyl-[acyl-carrier-protein] reductase n=1 Tax=Hydnomerulius pinastri MD-312 TaxID=994086 RepID=A0A0C9VT26_9AGAM|nr:hypothetical protein HYDPIDRAFT_183364 [Hydnomerulius pinastri MD-312]